MTKSNVFKIVTPTRNSELTLDKTIRSILCQDFEGKIRYHIQDCLSSDGTIDIAQKWKETLQENGNFLGNASVEISIDSRGDKGMYDAINHGFHQLGINEDEDAWLTWINSDDIMCKYALKVVDKISHSSKSTRWIGGSAAVMINDIPVSINERRLCSDFLREGLADGMFCDFVQQEGTFFKQSLYKDAGKGNAFGGLRYAGDWNLWRMFAYRAEIIQVKCLPLAYFVISNNQLSKTFREKYNDEIASKISIDKRRTAAESLLDKNLIFYQAHFQWDTSDVSITKSYDSIPFRESAFRCSYVHNESNAHLPRPTDTSDKIDNISGPILRSQNILVFKSHWQYPAITEKKAAQLSIRVLHGFEHVGYIGFPWASLIDLLNAGKPEAQDLLLILQAGIKDFKNEYKRIFSVCQHIHALRYPNLFIDAGITDLFWSHLAKRKYTTKFKLHPFPLYAVNYSQEWKKWHQRAYDVNFVGAQAANWYMTQTRNYILTELEASERCVITGNLEWFFNDVVYKKQISGDSQAADDDNQKAKAASFAKLLGESVFTLCPSGTGPNTLRLWEAIASGSIPIILSDQWRVPGDFAYWNQACIFLPDSMEGVRQIAPLIRSLFLNPRKIAKMQESLKDLFLLYGPDTFISDIYMAASRYDNILCSLDSNKY